MLESCFERLIYSLGLWDAERPYNRAQRGGTLKYDSSPNFEGLDFF